MCLPRGEEATSELQNRRIAEVTCLIKSERVKAIGQGSTNPYYIIELDKYWNIRILGYRDIRIVDMCSVAGNRRS